MEQIRLGAGRPVVAHDLYFFMDVLHHLFFQAADLGALSRALR